MTFVPETCLLTANRTHVEKKIVEQALLSVEHIVLSSKVLVMCICLYAHY